MATRPPQSGDVLDGRYELLETLGEGGSGQVWRARQRSTGQAVAVKILLPELVDDADSVRSEIARFERETYLIGSVHHPHIVHLIDAGHTDDGCLFTVLEYIDGESLDEALRREGRLTLDEALPLMIQVLDAVAAAHERGVVHRDLKPANIMITTAGLRSNALVLDFGVSALLEGGADGGPPVLDGHNEVRGTPAYMAPEQLRRETPTPRTDLYAWGLILIECLTGQPLVNITDPIEAARWQLSDAPVVVPERIEPEELRYILARAVAKDLRQRHESAADLYEELLTLKPAAMAVRANEAPRPWASRRPSRMSLSALAPPRRGASGVTAVAPSSGSMPVVRDVSGASGIAPSSGSMSVVSGGPTGRGAPPRPSRPPAAAPPQPVRPPTPASPDGRPTTLRLTLDAVDERLVKPAPPQRPRSSSRLVWVVIVGSLLIALGLAAAAAVVL